MTALVEPILGAIADALDPRPAPYLSDPVGWVRDKLGEFLWSKQREVAESVRDNRYTAVPSAHDLGKSHIASRLIAWWLDVHPNGSAFAVSTAPTATQVEAILWREVRRAHQRGSLDGRITQGSVPMWKVGEEIIGYGRKPADLTDPDAASAAFSGIHAEYVLVVLDEAVGIPKWLWDAVDTLATNEDARVLAIGNPLDPTSEFAKAAAPDSGWNTIFIDAYDSPNFTGEPVPDLVKRVLVSRTWVEERKARWGEDSPAFIARVRGRFPEIADDVLISPALLRRAYEVDRSALALATKGRYGVDVARSGGDESVIYRNRNGYIRLEFAKIGINDTMKLADIVAIYLNKHFGDVHAVVDIIGVGAGVYDRLRQRSMPVIPHQGSERAGDPTRFANRRAEVYWRFREGLADGLYDLDPDDDELGGQLTSVRYTIDTSGRVKLETKEEMAKRGVSSPDRADAVVMSCVDRPDIRTIVANAIEQANAAPAEDLPDLSNILEQRF